MSRERAEKLIIKAKEQVSHTDIIKNLITAMEEIVRELKRLEDSIQRTRRDIRMNRRF